MNYTIIDSTILKLCIPILLLVVLYLIIRNINKTYTSGTLFIDYFKIRKLDIIFSFIFIYIMSVFLALTIIFSYNQLYINDKTCNPLMLYLGSERACLRTNFENFENFENETILEKIAFLFEFIKYPFLKLYSMTLAIIIYIYQIILSIYSIVVFYANSFFVKQDEMCDKIKTVFIEPLLIRITDPVIKVIQTTIDNFSVR